MGCSSVPGSTTYRILSPFLVLLLWRGTIAARQNGIVAKRHLADVVSDKEYWDNGSVLPGQREEYIREKLGIERSALANISMSVGKLSLNQRQSTSVPHVPKVAFLFLLMDDLHWPELWNNFFSAALRDRYSIYLHRALKPNSAEAVPPLPLEQWGAVNVPWVNSAWCALFGVEVALLSAALKDIANTQFVFISDSTLPMKHFDYIYKQLAEVSPKTSKFCLAAEANHETAMKEVATNELQGRCYYRDFYRGYNPRTLKHHQWVVLAREHAKAIVQHAREGLDSFEASWRAAVPDLPNRADGCSDEAAPLAALLFSMKLNGRSTGNTWSDLTRMGIEQQCLTYVGWRNCFTGTGYALKDITNDVAWLLKHYDEVWKMLPGTNGFTYDFEQSAIKRDLNGFPHAFNKLDLSYLKRMVREGFMFARKFAPNATVETENGPAPLTAILPALWDDVDEKYAQKTVWVSLDTTGMPAPLAVPAAS